MPIIFGYQHNPLLISKQDQDELYLPILYMHKIQYILLFILCTLCIPQTVHAYEKEAGEAAKLASGAAVQKEKKLDKRIIALSTYLESVHSPLAPHAEIFISEADEHNVDWRLVPAIAGLESSFGKHVPSGSYNPFGWGIYTGKASGIGFTDWSQAISTVTQGIKEKYIDDGLTTVEAIGSRYAASTTWAPRIRYFMEQFDIASTKNSKQEISLTL